MTVRELAVIVKGIAPVVRETVQALSDRLDALQALAKGEAGPIGPRGPEGPVGRDGRDGLSGLPGEKGAKGIDGKDGADGLGFSDLSVLHDGERTVTFRFQKGSDVTDIPIVFPVEIYQGVYVDSRTYTRGDSVTWGGSEWHCNDTTTTKPGDGSKNWTLKVKRGRDGKDGEKGERGPEGKAGKDWQQTYDAARQR